MQQSTEKEKKFFYSSIADQFDELQDSYDLQRRNEIIFKKLINIDLKGKKYLEVGCGTGNLLFEPMKQGAETNAIDISFELLVKAHQKVNTKLMCSDALFLPFANSSFDLVVSSEVIEHTVDPFQAVQELSRVVKENGWLIITCPNKKWQWAINLSTKLKINKFHGIENFPDFINLEKFLISIGLSVKKHIGFHPWPYQLRFLRPISKFIDNKFGDKGWGRFMINQALIANKSREN